MPYAIASTRVCAVAEAVYRKVTCGDEVTWNQVNKTMKVLVADPQPSVRRALSVWISGQLGWNVVGECGDSFNLLEKIKRLTPEVIIMDRDLPGIATRELVAEIRRLSKEAAIVMLCDGSLGQLNAGKLEVDFTISKIEPPDRTMVTLLKVKTWLECRKVDNQDRDCNLPQS